MVLTQNSGHIDLQQILEIMQEDGALEYDLWIAVNLGRGTRRPHLRPERVQRESLFPALMRCAQTNPKLIFTDAALRTPRLSRLLLMASVAVLALNIKSTFSIMASSAGFSFFHVCHRFFHMSCNGMEYLIMAFFAFDPKLAHMDIMAVQYVSRALGMKKNVPAPYCCSRGNNRHQQHNQHSKNNQLSHFFPLVM